MGAADGRVIGTTKIVDNGDAAARWNLVIVAEGYRETELPHFATDAQSFVDTLGVTPPFDGLMRALNVYRVDVASTDSGADDPIACGGSGATPATFFDASFCANGIQRLLVVDNLAVFNAVNAEVPEWHMVLVIVNSIVYGGSGGQVAVFSLAGGANEIALHEMGHTAFGLADEYEFYAGCGVDTDRDLHPAVEPTQPNVTIDANRDTIKWGSLIAAATPVPTTSNPDCALCDPQPSPVSAGTVGAFEGAHYYHCGAFRPAFDCRMRALGQPFCPVCQQRIRETLAPFLPPPEEPAHEPAWHATFHR
jgi:hypothetical protein